MKMNVYEGRLSNRHRFVLVNDEMLLYIFDDPNWGYVGHSSAKVAEAIMVNEIGREVDRTLINLFLEQVVAKWPGRAGWVITSQEIESWQEAINV